MINYTLGDSLTVGVGASTTAKSWVGLATPVNLARNGDMAAELSNKINGIGGAPLVPEPSKTYSIMIGVNDQKNYRGDAVKQGYYKSFLRCALAYLFIPVKNKARDALITYTGTWGNTPVNTYGKYSATPNSTAETTVNGTSVYVSYIIQNSNSYVAEIRVDGVLKKTINVSTTPMGTANGSSYASACERIDGLSPGSHTVNVKVISAAAYFYLEWIGGNEQVSSPRVLLGNVIKMSNAAYTQFATSDTIVNAYNTIIDDLITEFTADGFDVDKVDVHSVINPLTDLTSDGVHPNDAGHLKIFQAFSAA